MSINSVNSNNSADKIYDLLQQGNNKKGKEVAETEQNPWEDIVELSNKKPDVNSVSSLKADFAKNNDALRQMVQTLIQKQGGYAQGAGADFLYKVDAETQAWAQEQISEDGYWGVNKTAERILNFAKAISGGDTAKADELIGAIQKGFAQAEKAWGGKLPDISQQTIDKVMQGMEDWKNGN